MLKIKGFIKSKSCTQLITYGVLLAGIIADIVFIAIDINDKTFSISCALCILLGSIVGLTDLFVGFRGVFGWIASLAYAVAIALHINVALPSVSDLWNNVDFIGGNQEIAIIFGVIFIVFEIALLVLNFLEKDKNIK